jgi:hypothetical protein
MDILERVKDIAGLVKKYNDQELYQHIVDLREQILGLREENLQLRERNNALETTANIQEELVRDGNLYFRKDDPKKEHPYCVPCWDYDRKLIGLLNARNKLTGEAGYECRICAARMAKGL